MTDINSTITIITLSEWINIHSIVRDCQTEFKNKPNCMLCTRDILSIQRYKYIESKQQKR